MESLRHATCTFDKRIKCSHTSCMKKKFEKINCLSILVQPILSIAIKKTIETEEFCMLFERTIILIYIWKLCIKKTKQDVYRPWWSPESHSPYTDLSEGVIFAFQDLFWSSNPKPKLCYLCILKLIFKTKIIHKEGTGSEEASKRKIWL